MVILLLLINKKSIFFFFIGSITCSPLLPINSETAPEVSWTKLLGSSTSDRSYGVATASDGSIYITGRAGGDLDGETNAGGNDAFLAI